MVNQNAMNQFSNYPWLNWYVSNLKSIPGGTYRFGFTKPPAGDAFGLFGNPKPPAPPASRITMSPFRMGATPVTWGMWKEYCKAALVRMPDKPDWGYLDDHPVVFVSWNDIMDPGGFCEWASGVAGFRLTLPSDAQWEYAARGGKDGLEYPWGNDFDASKLWCRTKELLNVGETAAVDRTNKIYRNGYGLTDMLGNVNQWCADYYHEYYRPIGKDPVDTQESGYRCVRGGSWKGFSPYIFRCANRDRNPVIMGFDYGFRLSAGPK